MRACLGRSVDGCPLNFFGAVGEVGASKLEPQAVGNVEDLKVFQMLEGRRFEKINLREIESLTGAEFESSILGIEHTKSLNSKAC